MALERQEQIIAMGGGGFSMEESPLLDDYILSASGKPSPRICFVGTASGDSEGNQLKFFKRFAQADCRPVALSLFRREISDLEGFLCSQDIVYVGGGNTVNMLAIWREHGFDQAIATALKSGTVLAGLSAGSICWFEEGVTDSYGSDLRSMNCLGFLKGSHCPHYDGEANRRPTYHRLLENGLKPGYAADDGVGLHFIDGKLQKVVSSRENAKGYYVSLTESGIVETELETTYLAVNHDGQEG